MKKMISFLLVVVFILTGASITVYAEDENKIESRLLDVLEMIEDDFKIQIFVWINDTVDENVVVQMTYEQCGLTKETAKTQEEVDLYLSTYRNIKANLYENYNNYVFEKMGIEDKDVIFFSKLTPSFILKATKAKVYELAQMQEVVSIGLYKMPLIPQPDHLFEARFLELYGNMVYTDTHDYDELYYHYDENGDIDWALIKQCSHNAEPWEYNTFFKGRIFVYGSHTPFSFGYGLYDVKEDKFYDIINEDFDYSKYQDLEEVFESFNFGYPLGDADHDRVLSILDATAIQLHLANIQPLSYSDEVGGYHGYVSWDQLGYPKYISDMNCDGNRDILDATAIQLKLAGLEY